MEFSFKLKNENGDVSWNLIRHTDAQEILSIVHQALSALRVENGSVSVGGTAYAEEELEEDEEEEEEDEEDEEDEEEGGYYKIELDKDNNCLSEIQKEIEEKILSAEDDAFVITPLYYESENKIGLVTSLRKISGFTLASCRDMLDGKIPMGVLTKEQAAKLYFEWRKNSLIFTVRSAREREVLQQMRGVAVRDAENMLDKLDTTGELIIMQPETDEQSVINEEAVP